MSSEVRIPEDLTPEVAPRRVVRWLLYFIPPRLQADPDVRRRALFVSLFSLTYLSATPAFLFLDLVLYDVPAVAVGVVVSAVMMIAGLLFLKRRGNLTAAVSLFVSGGAGAIFSTGFTKDGLLSPAMVYLGTLPIISVMLAGRRAGLVVTGFVMVCLPLLAVVPNYLVLELPSFPSVEQQTTAAWNLTFFVIVCWGLAWLYESIRERAMASVTEAQAILAREREQRILTDRLASLGTLVAGVAHEINNPLAFISGNMNIVQNLVADLRESDGDPELLEDIQAALDDMHDGTQRIRQLVDDLRGFSRHATLERTRVDLVAVARQATRMVTVGLRCPPDLFVDELEGPIWVDGDPGRLQQVFLNLITNAVQALDEKEEKRVTLVAGKASGVVWAEVRDTGCGVPTEDLSRIFDPFFTTKPVGSGTGLGLSICHNLLVGLGGTLAVESVLGQGSVFRVEFPPLRSGGSISVDRSQGAGGEAATSSPE